jgi:hypothetical protein
MLQKSALVLIGEPFVERSSESQNSMRTLLVVILWCILFVMCWPLALLLIFLLPIIWLILLPFRILGFTIEAIFKLITAIITLPFRIVKGIVG